MTAEKAEELFNAPSGEREVGIHPETGFTIVAKTGRFGPYVTEILPEGTKVKGRGAIKPKTASLFKTMNIDEVDMELALRLMSLPRSLGADPDGVEITAQNGPFGPYLRRGTDSRSLPSEEAIFSVDMDEALALYAQPKTRGRGVAKEPLATYGNDPVSNQLITLREGRFGLYVTDGETNASLRTTDTAESMTPERAIELISDRRERGPAVKKRAARKAPAKKAAAPAKKAVAKKVAAKKAVAPLAKTVVKKAAAKKVAKKAAAKKTGVGTVKKST
jgi:DNA topoisomerase-1